MNFKIEEIGKTVKKNPVLFGVGAVGIIGLALFTRKRNSEVGFNSYPQLQEQKMPEQSFSEGGGMRAEDLQVMTELITDSLQQSAQMNAMLLAGVSQEIQTGYSGMLETIKTMLPVGLPGGAYPGQYYYQQPQQVIYQQPIPVYVEQPKVVAGSSTAAELGSGPRVLSEYNPSDMRNTFESISSSGGNTTNYSNLPKDTQQMLDRLPPAERERFANAVLGKGAN